MDPLGNLLKQISTDIKEYVEARIDLLFLSVSDTITKWIGQSVQRIIGLSVVLLGFIFALTAAAIALGEWLDNHWLGYLIVSLPLLIVGSILMLSRPGSLSKGIQKQLMSDLLRSLDEKEKSQKALPPADIKKEAN